VALDWHMLEAVGDPDPAVPWVPMGADAHAELFARVGLHRPHHGQGRYPGNQHRRAAIAPAERPLPPLPLLARAADYYADAAFEPAEVPGLLAELVAVGQRVGPAGYRFTAQGRQIGHDPGRRRGVVAVAD
jgi:hypothetical protein